MRPSILGIQVDPAGYPEVTECIASWASAGESRYVCVANVHMVMEAHKDPVFREIVNAADLIVPDGMPLVWMLRRMGFSGQGRVAGPDLTLCLAREAERRNLPVGFYGSTRKTLERLVDHFSQRFPHLPVRYAFSPPFRPLTPEEDEGIIEDIQTSGVRLLFVGLGCPKQERWMAQHKGRVPAVMLGVGAAFDFHAGTLRRAPRWMQDSGLEWLHRLCSEPKRLWKRYLVNNTLFIGYAAKQLLQQRKALWNHRKFR